MRIVEENVPVVNPGKSISAKKIIVAQDLEPQIVDDFDFGKEAVSANIEQESPIVDRPRKAAYRIVLFADGLLEQGVLDGSKERQTLDSLSRPVGGHLGAGSTPDFLRVGLEEDMVEPLAEAVGYPRLEAFFRCRGK